MLWEQVRGIAAGYARVMGTQQQSGTAVSKIAPEVGNLITFVPPMMGIRFDPLEQAVTWQPPYQTIRDLAGL